MAANFCKLPSMATIVLSVLVFIFAAVILTIGSLYSKNELKGSCGGTSENCACSGAAHRQCENKTVIQ